MMFKMSIECETPDGQKHSAGLAIDGEDLKNRRGLVDERVASLLNRVAKFNEAVALTQRQQPEPPPAPSKPT